MSLIARYLDYSAGINTIWKIESKVHMDKEGVNICMGNNGRYLGCNDMVHVSET